MHTEYYEKCAFWGRYTILDISETKPNVENEQPEAEKASGKRKTLGADYLSFFCMELYLSVKAGVPLDEGVAMLRDHEADKTVKTALDAVCSQMKIGGAIACSRFASAMAMTMESGLDVDDSLGMAERLTGNPAMLAKIADLRAKMAEDMSFADAVEAADIFPKKYGRMLAVAFRAGAADAAMSEIARRTEDDAEDAVESLIGRIEPTLVIIMSVLVGLILLSVMLPLMNIMNGMGI